MSNRRKLPPRPPDEAEAAFAAELRRGCPECGSRRVTGRFHDGVWDYRLSCRPDCRTHVEQHLAHKFAAEAAERAGLATGQRLGYRAVDSCGGQVAGVVVGQAGAG